MNLNYAPFSRKKTDTTDSVAEVIISNALVTEAWDYVSQSQDATTDTWVFKSGGAGGATVATVTIVYTDATKAVISSVART